MPPVLQRFARQRVALAPPSLGCVRNAAFGRRLQQNLERFFVPVAAAVGARSIVEQTAIAMQLGGKRRHDARDRLGAALQAEPCFGDAPGLSIDAGDLTPRRRDVVERKPLIQPCAMIGIAQDVAMGLKDRGFFLGAERIPRSTPCGSVAFRARDCPIPDAPRRGGSSQSRVKGSRSPYHAITNLRIDIGRHRFFGAREQRVAPWPIRMRIQERAELDKARVASRVGEIEPLDEKRSRTAACLARPGVGRATTGLLWRRQRSDPGATGARRRRCGWPVAMAATGVARRSDWSRPAGCPGSAPSCGRPACWVRRTPRPRPPERRWSRTARRNHHLGAGHNLSTRATVRRGGLARSGSPARAGCRGRGAIMRTPGMPGASNTALSPALRRRCGLDCGHAAFRIAREAVGEPAATKTTAGKIQRAAARNLRRELMLACCPGCRPRNKSRESFQDNNHSCPRPHYSRDCKSDLHMCHSDPAYQPLGAKKRSRSSNWSRIGKC